MITFSKDKPRRSKNLARRSPPLTLAKDPLWYKDAIIYEVHVRAFFDSNGDGIGDFVGLTQKLDYLQDLGVTAIWLLPFYPSPLKDDGYDIADYYSINPLYGSLKDFKQFLNEAHHRGLRVITELVVNHTSDQHPWFQQSRRARKGSAWRDFYVWTDNPEKYREARIIFRDFEPSNWSWDPIAHSYYWHRFYAHQPDLNYDNPQVHKEIGRALDFWLDLGVDGLRLDAVPYLYEREGTSCENLKETHQYLKHLRRHVDEKYGDRMLLAEANQWPEDAVSYFGEGKGDECHMAFHFPLMPRIFMAVRMEDRVPIVDILEQTPTIPETSQWALFLRNHDELTLEMVTDEERDYMYRVYANDAKARINLGIRRRLAPLLENNRRKIELLHLLLLSYPGTPVLYYGDEIGMGDNVFLGDRNGVRTPMQWSSDKNSGFSRASQHALYLPIILDPEYHYEAVNVEAQQRNSNSLWWWMKRVLTLRKRYKAFGRGTMRFLQPGNRKILAFVRQHEGETILVVANLSRFSQPVKLDLSEYNHLRPIELFGRTEFPDITQEPYPLTMGPHAAFWFSLEAAPNGEVSESNCARETLLARERWEEILVSNSQASLETCIASFIRNRRWFGGKGRVFKAVQIRDSIPLPFDSSQGYVLILLVDYMEGDPEEYVLPIAFATGAQREELERSSPQSIIARLRVEMHETEGVVYSIARTKELARTLFGAIARKRSFPGKAGILRALPAPSFRVPAANSDANLEPKMGNAEQSNTSIIFGDKYFLKLFRKVEPGLNPDLEVGRFLTQQNFPNTPAVNGSLEYQNQNGEKITIGILTDYLPNSKDAWEFTLETLSRYYERVRTASENTLNPNESAHIIDLAFREVPEGVVALIGTYMEAARLLGQRSGELHLALAADSDNKDFAPEPFTPFYQRSLYQSLRNMAVQNLDLLRRSLNKIPEPLRPEANRIIGLEPELLRRLRSVADNPIKSLRIRCHGDFHLGQILYTGKDFIAIDFEGEPARPLGERRIKRSPLRDIAGMIRSFDYITYAALFKQVELGTIKEEDVAQYEPWAAFWHRWVSATYFKAYWDVVHQAKLLPESISDLLILLDAHLLEKAAYEIGYEINNRPAWLKIPIRGILQLLEASSPKVSPPKESERV